ncbi:MAG: HD-GYP domain-containing protein [Desulfovibrio sp.]
MTRNRYRAAAPLLLLGSAALLIALLLGGILSFGHKVTTYYTPSILAFQDLLRSIDHLSDSLQRGKGRLEPEHPALLHFRDALAQAEELHATYGSGRDRTDDSKDFLPLARGMYVRLAQGLPIQDPERLTALRDRADRQLAWHEAELSGSMTTIGILSVSTGALCMFLIGLGIWGSLRERHHARLRHRQVESSSALQALVRSLDARDPYTRGHSDRVTEYALRLGQRLGLPEPRLATLKLAARLHDIGKIGLPDAVLLKEGGLDAEEYAKMRQHPATGARMLAPFPRLADVSHIVLHHHERWDGKGYPDGLAGDKIPQLAQIISIADAYDAMTSSRPYRHALEKQEAVAEILRCAGKQWSVPLAGTFLRMLGEDEVAAAASPRDALPASSAAPT